ncbi:hypothetical protein GLOIN_2v75200 [Rhizophagus irregularis DAOM 181602=DAOM 197198]|nr:hypothetical protein GLOIN_2v75200 [Rhizophagus irregularis DAOM 181602=DAOM 197198]
MSDISVEINDDADKIDVDKIDVDKNDDKIFTFDDGRHNVNDKIIVYSIELGIIIASLDINDDIQLYNFIKYKNMDNQTLFDKPTDEPTDAPTDDQTKFVFGILNERVWKSKFYENTSKTKVIKCDDDDKKTYNHLNVHSFNPYMDTVSTLFQKVTTNGGYKEELTESIENLIKWEIYSDYYKIRLEVFKKINTEWELISTRIENHPYRFNHYLIASSLFNNNDIVILAEFGNGSTLQKNIFKIYFTIAKL